LCRGDIDGDKVIVSYIDIECDGGTGEVPGVSSGKGQIPPQNPTGNASRIAPNILTEQYGATFFTDGAEKLLFFSLIVKTPVACPHVRQNTTPGWCLCNTLLMALPFECAARILRTEGSDSFIPSP
jgi:hypothetical protein